MVAAYVSSEVRPRDKEDHFEDLSIPNTFIGYYDTRDYQRNFRFDADAIWEKGRRDAVSAYKKWINRMAYHTLGCPGQSKEYVDAMYLEIRKRVTEQLSHERGLRRFRSFSAN